MWLVSGLVGGLVGYLLHKRYTYILHTCAGYGFWTPWYKGEYTIELCND